MRAWLIGVTISLCACQPAPVPDTSEAQEAATPCAGLEGFAAYACARPEWQARDNELNRYLARLQAGVSHSEKQDLRVAQRQWETLRNACLDGPLPEREPCLESRFTERMAELQALDL